MGLKRSQILGLDELKWFKPFPEKAPDLEVGLVPREALRVYNNSGDTDSRVRDICRRAFIDFRGYEEDDGAAIENTLEARLELYSICGVLIDTQLVVLNQAAVTGEGSAA